jgi:(1->4)-alpha-D-glucan 1-alpha-D-glucosylmutase
MTTTSTHDTKRSEDVRARISLLSEIPEKWKQAVRRWANLNNRHRKNDLPDRNSEYLFYQTLIGSWPIEKERLLAYMEKAVREAKVHTSWTKPDEEYETAVAHFINGALSDPEFVEDLERFVDPIIRYGRITSVSQTLIKLTAPGVPDIYQGAEIWNLSLVDPDNRRAVDFELRRRLFRRLESATPEEVLDGMDDGLPKLWVVRQALGLRRRRPELFGSEGEYHPLSVSGSQRSHAIAFSRSGDAITVAPRLVVGLGNTWNDTTVDLPSGEWHNHLTGDTVCGGRVLLADLLERFPAALLSREA